MEAPFEPATSVLKDVTGIKVEEQIDGEVKINSVLDDSRAPVISKITDIKIEPVSSYDEDNIKVQERDVLERLGIAAQGTNLEDVSTSGVNESENVALKCEETECNSGQNVEEASTSGVNEQIALKCEQTECISDVIGTDELLDNSEMNSTMYDEVPGSHAVQIQEQTDGEALDTVNGAPVISEITSAGIKIESVWSYDEDNIKMEESDVYVRERLRLTTQGRNPESASTSEAYETEQLAAKCEQTECSSDVQYKSDVCMNFFSRKSHLIGYSRTHVGKKPYQCDVCMKCFSRKDYLIDHIRIHTGEKPYKCDVCFKCFKNKDALNKHKKIHTGEKKFQCDICMKCFVRKDYLIKHTRLHAGEKPFKCDICLKCFPTKWELIRHSMTHTGKKPYKCDICMKCFYTKGELSRHSRTHTGERPYKCDVCNQSYKSRSDLINHGRKHADKNPFKCDIWEECFLKFIRHDRTHTGEKPSKCNIEEQSEGEEIINSVVDDSGAPNISKISIAGTKIESVWSSNEDNIKIEECDVYVPERLGLATKGRDVDDASTIEVNESEQCAVKCEQTGNSDDVTSRDESLEYCEIIANCDQTDDRSNSASNSFPKNARLYVCVTCNGCFNTKVEIIEHVRVHW